MKPRIKNPKHTSANGGFEVQLEQGIGWSVIHLAGSIGIRQGEQFEKAMLKLVSHVPRVVVLDLTDLRFINVIGLGVIVRFGTAVRARGGRLVLTGANPRICRLIRQVHLHELFPPMEATSLEMERPPLAICA